MRTDPGSLRIVTHPLAGALTTDFVRSLRERAVRDRHGLFLSEGLRFLARAVDNAVPIAGLVFCREQLKGPMAHTLVDRVRQAGVRTIRLSALEFSELSLGADAQGIIAIYGQLWQGLPPTVGRDDLWIGLESVRVPGNLGTLLRTAEAAGATGLIAFGGSFRSGKAFGGVRTCPDPFDPLAVRASMGSVFAHRFVATTHREFRSWCHRYELTVLGATGDADKDYRLVSYRRPVLLMLGDERSGLSEAQRQTSDGFVRLPMHGNTDSLNLAIAGSILLYEARNQRHPVRR